MEFKLFQWGPRFECGIESVDTQHRRLVELVNQLARVRDEADAAALPSILDGIGDYVQFHFDSEEQVWHGAGLDPQILAAHQRTHIGFTEQIEAFRAVFDGHPLELAHSLHGYLCGWLVFHILGDDRRMAGLVLAGSGEGGETPARYVPDPLLVEALRSMDRALTTMNGRLRATNLELEQRVQARTRELQEQQERLQQVQRLESLGQLTGGVAHDFNNLLTVVLGNAEMLVQLLEDERLRPLALMIQNAALRGAELTRSLLAFARRQPLDPHAVDLHLRIVEMLPLLQRALGEQVEIMLVGGPGLPKAMVDAAQFDHALLNLCLNARDAMPAGGRLRIESAACRLEADAQTTRPAGNYLRVQVSDAGCGIAPEHLLQVFEPFFTTKEKGKGTGLGLSMVYGFVRQSGGQVELQSEPGTGTTVSLYLPLAAADAVDAAGVVAEGPLVGGSETVLLVEDDIPVRELVRNQLAALGYCVVVAGNGPEALSILGVRDEIDLLFTDVVMPGGMNGHQLASAALALRPRLRVLYTSGYTDNAVVHDGRLDSGVRLLNKPYRHAELAAMVRSALLQSAEARVT